MAEREVPATGWFVAIEGATGCGKSTLARRLAGPLDAQVSSDPFDRNPFLVQLAGTVDGRGEDIALVTELTFLALRVGELRRISALVGAGGRVVADWALVKTRVFPRLTLTPCDADRIEAACTLWEPGLRAPDLLIHLRADPSLLAQRIKSRGRDFEQHITLAELGRLSEMFSTVLSGLPVIEVDAGAFDAFDDTAVGALAGKILTHLSKGQ